MIFKTAGCALFACAVALSENPAATQDPVPLTPRAAKKLDVPAGPMAIPIRCSSEGDLAVRTIDGFNESLLYVQANGTATRRVKLTDERLRNRSLLDFAAAGNGRIYALFSGQDRPRAPLHSFIATFDRDGRLEEAREIFPKIQPWQFTVLPNTGEIAVSGVAISEAGGRSRRQALELLDALGQWKQEIKLQTDLKHLRDEMAPPSGKRDDEQRRKLEQFEQAIYTSNLTHDEAGNLLFQRGGEKQPIFVVSPRGTLIRTILPPDFRKDAELIEFRYAQRRLLWRFIVTSQEDNTATSSRPPRAQNTEAVYFVETDAATGDQIRSYVTTDPQLTGPFGCYSPGIASFLTGGKNGLEFVTADLP